MIWLLATTRSWKNYKFINMTFDLIKYIFMFYNDLLHKTKAI